MHEKFLGRQPDVANHQLALEHGNDRLDDFGSDHCAALQNEASIRTATASGHERVIEDAVEFARVLGLMKVVGRNRQLLEQRLGVDGHLDLAGHFLPDFATVGDQHRQRDIVVLNERHRLLMSRRWPCSA